MMVETLQFSVTFHFCSMITRTIVLFSNIEKHRHRPFILLWITKIISTMSLPFTGLLHQHLGPGRDWVLWGQCLLQSLAMSIKSLTL